MVAKPKPPPQFAMPVAPILQCRALVTATGAVYRSTVALALAYWLSGCRPLPDDDTTVPALIRASPSNWRAVKSEVIAALAEITPYLDHAHAKAMRVYRVNQSNGRRSLDIRLARIAAAQRQTTTPIQPLALPVRDNTPRNPQRTAARHHTPPTDTQTTEGATPSTNTQTTTPTNSNNSAKPPTHYTQYPTPHAQPQQRGRHATGRSPAKPGTSGAAFRE